MSVSLSSVLSCSITSSGISAPTYDEIRDSLVTVFQSIYGSDISLDNSTQDGQLIGIFAEAIDQVNSACMQVYNAFSPTFAQGAGLSSVVMINGIARKASSYSTVDILLTGTAGTVLNNCLVQDVNNNQWVVPNGTVIPNTQSVTVTATCKTAGAVSVDVGDITTIATPTLGWTGVTNETQSSPGIPPESDATLRARQVSSTMLPSSTVLDGIRGAILSLPGVSGCYGYDNPSATTDERGLPGHSISMVVVGGDSQQIAETIANKRTPGVTTYGNTVEVVTDDSGYQQTIQFYRPTYVPVTVTVQIQALTGFTNSVSLLIQQAVSDYISNLPPGSSFYVTRLYKPATLDDSAGGQTYDIVTISASNSTGSGGFSFYQLPVCPVSNVSVVVSS